MIKNTVVAAIEWAGYRIKRRSIGDDYLQELVFQMKNKLQPVIFDVGAHRGETALTFSRAFPDAQLYCFEPFRESFDALKANSATYPNAQLFNIGLSDTTGPKTFNVNEGSPTNSLLELDAVAQQTWSYQGLTHQGKVECQFYALDEFVDEHKIDQIDLLKIDVQGAEYQVFEGAKIAIETGKIRAMYFEIIVGPTYVGQWGLGRYFSYLEEKGFQITGLYNFAYGVEHEIIQLDALCVYRG